MYLSLSQKREIFKSFPELTEFAVKDGRIGYRFEGSTERRKVIAHEFTNTGNGYVYGKNLAKYQHVVDDRGWVNVRDFNETELRDIIKKAIDTLR